MFGRNSECVRRFGRRRRGRKGFFLDDALLTASGVSVGREALLLRYEKLNESEAAPSGYIPYAPWCGLLLPTGRLFPRGAVVSHVDNARAHLQSDAHNPSDAQNRQSDLLRRTIGRSAIGEVRGRAFGSPRNPNLCISYPLSTEVAFQRCSKLRQRSGTWRRGPRHRPGIQKIEYIWWEMKGGYAGRACRKTRVFSIGILRGMCCFYMSILPNGPVRCGVLR